MSTTPHAVIQPKPGIGDVIWHLPFIRAIAAVSPGEQVTFLAPPTSGARELLVAEPAVAETIYFQHSGSELQRGINLMRLVALLRRRHFQKIWILDRTIRPALAAFLAGIPERIGVGLTAQRRFITNTGIPQSHFHDFPIEWLVKLMADMGVPFTTTEPGLRIPSETLAAIGERFAECAAAVDRARDRRVTSGQGLVRRLLAGTAQRLAQNRGRHGLFDRWHGE